MEKLELKHLAPYLDHKLKFKINDLVCTMIGLTEEIVFTETGFVFNYSSESAINLLFPILRPLSDFKEPTRGELKEKYNCSSDVIEEVWRLMYDDFFKLKQISLETYEMFCKNHIDFQGLIEKNLAIDINTLTNNN